MEGDLDELIWSRSYYEISKKIELKISEKSALALCHFTSVHRVAKAALGGDDTPTAPPRPAIPEPMHESDLEGWVQRVNAGLRY